MDRRHFLQWSSALALTPVLLRQAWADGMGSMPGMDHAAMGHGTASDAAKYGDIVIIAVPLSAIGQLPAEALRGKQIIDAVNYYPERDGEVEILASRQTTTSELLAGQLPGSTLTKAFNAIPMTQLESDGLPAGDPARRALPVAGDDPEGKKIVGELYDAFGFDTVDAGPLAEGWRFERGMPAYCVRMTKNELTQTLNQASRN